MVSLFCSLRSRNRCCRTFSPGSNIFVEVITMKYCFGFLLLSLVVAGCLFPATVGLRDIIMDYDSFTRKGEMKTYDALSLKSYNNEIGPVFVEYGVDSCFVSEFVRAEETYKVELFSFLNPRGSIGSYYFLDNGSFSSFDLGYYARKNETRVDVVNGHYLITVTREQNGTINGALELAAGLTKRIDGGSFKPNIFSPLPHTNFIEGTEFYFSGRRSFASRFGLALARALNVQLALNGVSGEYDVEGTNVTVIKIRFQGRQETMEAINAFLNSRRDRPILKSEYSLRYNTVIESDHSEIYIAEIGDTLLFMMNGDKGGASLEFFEYLLRGGM